MKIGVIADDFTGASDIALTLAEGGMRTAQFVGIPDPKTDVEAGVVALKSRTIPVQEAIDQSLAACDWLLTQGAEQIIFKICSTFDSTDAGNIGQVAEALGTHLGAKHILTCPAFPANGRSVYMGHLFVGDVLLNESGMQDHPLTPMKDADLRRVLARQTRWHVAQLPHALVSQGPTAMAQALPAGPAMVIVDAISEADLYAIGKLAKGQKLLTGGSGIALGLPANFGADPATPPWQAISGPGVVLSGSCSRATRGQVAHYKTSAPSLEINADDVMSGKVQIDDLAEWVLDQPIPPLIYSSADPEIVAEAQANHGRETIASRIEALFANLAAALAARGVKRIVVAGGETSGAVVTGLKAQTLYIGPKLAPGVPALRHGDIALALKSGNFGAEDFFTTALRDMETTR
ncbi:3-oxo-tetronate kinase [Cognatiyoonia sp. IB215446]|uniref:3-oxo-tetronate kinase n=1 Tax=Cognatiyoonia sp. IB215446 TaxID=3097355 RepID=UPI002A0B688E|nr:3-oxo-tetronate kinase [Cognatiyoonia sp. IB215446]MDX8350589.1 3-oxo-tetronate kinase [Cognatiyoonia sp. IB215446]